MKKIIFLILSASILASCTQDWIESHPTLLFCCSESTPTTKVLGTTYNQQKNNLSFALDIDQSVHSMSDHYPGTPYTDYQYMSMAVMSGGPEHVSSAMHIPDYIKDAYNTFIKPREKQVREEWGKIRDVILDSQTLIYMSVSAAPTITADRVLFGREPGADLSDLFYVKSLAGQDPVRRNGDGFTLAPHTTDDYYSFSEFFIPGTMVPSVTPICYAYSFPEELNDGEPVSLTITIPVTEEHYWNYVIALAKGQTVDEKFTDRILQGTVTLKKPE